MAKAIGIDRVYVHAFLDGRDVPPSSGAGFLQQLETKIAELGIGRVATISGRYYAMDRDKRMVYREGEHAPDSVAAIQAAYNRSETDEFVVPTVIDGCGDCGIKGQDGVIFFNFRPDRARQLTRTFVDEAFAGFNRRNGFFPLHFATMTQYEESLDVAIAYKPQLLTNTLGEVVSKAGLHQLRIAETEKYAHVTYFFNGGEEVPFTNEERLLVPSPKVATYDLQPTMSAVEVTTKLVAEIHSGKHDLIILNFANCDMVGSYAGTWRDRPDYG
ncbi:MAG: 2,3-bisphosphoglycerate-independent phosphoglycerate mutase [Anaerospora sp.]|nr:2,3-bisphosphoglycerate-independent phosphoglycerate mutase [Anaerospora sp.]